MRAIEIAPGEWGIIDGEQCLLRGFCGSAAAWSWIDGKRPNRKPAGALIGLPIGNRPMNFIEEFQKQ
jgi:hypothetical protein